MIFYPKSYFKNMLEVDMNFIEKNNIKAILLDIDNTMIDTDNNILEGLEDWVEEAKKHGIKFCILSKKIMAEKVMSKMRRKRKKQKKCQKSWRFRIFILLKNH